MGHGAAAPSDLDMLRGHPVSCHKSLNTTSMIHAALFFFQIDSIVFFMNTS